MVIDSSALLAILLDEPDAAEFANAIDKAPIRLMSAGSVLEASIVIEARKGEGGGAELDLAIFRWQIEVAPVDSDQAEIARAAWRKFGNGKHRAALNFGDLFSYALSKSTGLPLLYKGHVFDQTDVISALAP